MTTFSVMTLPAFFNESVRRALPTRLGSISAADQVILSILLTENISNLRREGSENPTGMHSRSRVDRERRRMVTQVGAPRGVGWPTYLEKDEGRWVPISITRVVQSTLME